MNVNHLITLLLDRKCIMGITGMLETDLEITFSQASIKVCVVCVIGKT